MIKNMIIYKRIIGLVVLVFLHIGCSSVNAQQTTGEKDSPYKDFKPGKLNPDAPAETAQLGRLVGLWEATQQVRNRDGSWSKKKTKADWIWYYILDGHAIQDDWISPVLDEMKSDGTRMYGTNIRIYNPAMQQWEMAWIDMNSRKVTNFVAIEEDNKIIMTGRDNQDQTTKISFYNITENSFDWLKEWTMDEGKSWFPVARIYCIRKK